MTEKHQEIEITVTAHKRPCPRCGAKSKVKREFKAHYYSNGTRTFKEVHDEIDKVSLEWVREPWLCGDCERLTDAEAAMKKHRAEVAREKREQRAKEKQGG